MPRRPRIVVPNVPLHIIQKGNNKQDCFFADDDYLLTCQRYIELNLVRAGIVAHPGEFRWSSYCHNGQGEMSDLIAPHILYKSLGETNDQQQSTYRELFRYELEPNEIDQIRKATNRNFALGAKRFQDEISIILGRRAFSGKAGRPRIKK